MAAMEFKEALERELLSNNPLTSTKIQKPKNTSTGDSYDDGDDEEDFAFSRVITPFIDIEVQHETEVFCVRYSNDSQWLAVGCGDGIVRVYNSQGRPVYTLTSLSSSSLPITSLRWKPASRAGSSVATRNVLMAANADGTLTHWHVTSQKALFTVSEKDNQVYATDYAPDASTFATAGRDFTVRVYDDETHECVHSFVKGVSNLSPGHSNRIFSLKYKPDDPNLMISGGWDNTMFFWDLRTDKYVRTIFGPHIAGDSVDILGDHVLAASWRPDKPVEIWDFGTAKLIHSVYYVGAPLMYAAQFHPSGDCLVAGGSGANEAKVFDIKNSYKPLGRIRLPQQRGVYTAHFSPNGNRLAIGGSSKTVRTLMVK